MILTMVSNDQLNDSELDALEYAALRLIGWKLDEVVFENDNTMQLIFKLHDTKDVLVVRSISSSHYGFEKASQLELLSVSRDAFGLRFNFAGDVECGVNVGRVLN